MFYKEINLPPIPTDIINSIESESSQIVKNSVNQNYGHDHFLMGTKLEPPVLTDRTIKYQPLLDWLNNFFNVPYKVYSLRYWPRKGGKILVHQDPPFRPHVLNYIIETGGENVITSWYKERSNPLVRDPKTVGQQSNTGKVEYKDLTLIESVCCKQNHWYFLKTNVLHDVSNLTSQRHLLSIIFENTNKNSFEEIYPSLITYDQSKNN